jgi:hypothetical protein
MLSHEPSIRRKEKGRAIKRSAVSLDDPDYQKNPGIPCSLPEGLTPRTGHIHSTFIVAPEIFTPFRCPGAHPGSEVQTRRIG